MNVVLDSSALLALILEETGADTVAGAIKDAAIGAVNLTETVSKLTDLGWAAGEIREVLGEYGMTVVSFHGDLAYSAGFLRAATRSRGLSLGDRACLALAHANGVRVLTADRAWAGLEVGVEIEVIR